VLGEVLVRGFLCSTATFAVLIVLIVCPMAWAAPVDDAIRQQQQLQRQEEQRRLELERQHREELQKAPTGEDLRLSEIPEAAPDAPCMETKSIEITGVTLLDQKEIDAITAKYIGRCLTLNDVNNLVHDITNAYVEKEYVTTRAAIPEQDLSSGHLVIMVVEGKVEGIEFKEGQGSQREIKGAFPGLAGKYLNLRDIEQGLDQINRLPSNNASMELLPGGEQGASRVVVSNERKKTWRASFGLDNTGQDSTGRNQYVLALAKDNLFGINDLLNITINGDSDSWLTDEHQKSATYNAFYSVPLGYWTFSGSFSHYKYRTEVTSGGANYPSEGDTTTTSLSVDRVLHRDQNGKTSLNVSLTHRDTQNYFNSGRLVATSQVLTSIGTTLGHTHRVLGGVASAQVGYSHGLPLLGAKRDISPSLDTARNEFNKFVFNGSFFRPLKVKDLNLSWNTSVTGQWAPHTLYSAEQISIGSRYTVRGFHDDSLSGDIGAYMRNELTLNLPNIKKKSPTASDWLGTMQFYAGYDTGVIRSDPKDLEERGSLQGAVVGMRTSGGRLVMDFAVARPIDAPAFLQKDDIEIYTSIKYSF